MKSKLLLGVGILALGIIAIWFVVFEPSNNHMTPRQASQWHLGKGSQYSPTMQYEITANGTNFAAAIQYLPSSNPENQTLLVQINPNSSSEINQTVPLNVVYDFNQVSDKAKPFFNILDSTIFSIRDIAIENKYLVKGAVWGDVYIGESHEEIMVTDYSKAPLKFGSLNSFTLSYKIGEKENKIWIVDNLPLPVKAEIYDLSGNLQYSYELTSLSAPSTPGLS